MKRLFIATLVIVAGFSLGGQAEAANELKVAAWVPYWTNEVGANTAREHISFFSELSPFAYEVDGKGRLIDRLKKNKKEWDALYREAQKKKVPIIPAILWTSSPQMEKILGNSKTRTAHVRTIVALVQSKGFAGIDIDYEGKEVPLKHHFSAFITELAKELHKKKKVLVCTIEARAQDDIPVGWDNKKAMSWSNDLTVLNRECDQIRVMTYDEQSQAIGKTWTASSTSPHYAPNASPEWMEKVIIYMTKYISPQKFMLGVPTYGWQYSVTPDGNDNRYRFYKSISYTKATTTDWVRDRSGEMTYTYQTRDRKVFVSLPDAVSIQDRFNLARKYGLRGVAIFKIDGLEDPKMWSIVK